jgi:hypothetical protein
LQTLPFLGDTFRLHEVAGVVKNKRTRPTPSDWSLKLTYAVILDFFFRNWSAIFVTLWNPVENLLFTILIKNARLPSMSKRIRLRKMSHLMNMSSFKGESEYGALKTVDPEAP